MKNNLSRAGFSLIELLVTLGILGLALAVVPPMLTNTLDASRLKSSTRDLAAGLRQARSEAIAKQMEAALLLDVEKGTFTVNESSSSLILPETAEITLTTAGTEQTSESAGKIRFFPDGSSTGGRIEIRHRTLDYIIDVNWLTGKISITP